MTCSNPDRPIPLCVDLDGTLVRTDLLLEAIAGIAATRPSRLLLLPVWLLGGKARLKHRVAKLVDVDAETLPYNRELLQYLEEEKSRGRQLVLATSANRRHAQKVADYLGCFDRVLASDESINLGGATKGERLAAEFGEAGFDYVADAHEDFGVWRFARRALLVNPSPGVEKMARSSFEVTRVFKSVRPGWRTPLDSLRLHQWLKNLLVFVPLITSHQLADTGQLRLAALAFLAFGLCASAMYLLNDALDLPFDRRHATKRSRALARGDLSLAAGLGLGTGLLGAAVLTAFLLPPDFLAVLVVYCILAVAYSMGLKRLAMVDVLLLSVLYTLRLLAGGAATGIDLSFWLLAFSLFLFLSLALAKRYSELQALYQSLPDQTVRGRGYRVRDLESLAQFGAVSGYLSVLVLALYVNSADVQILYARPRLIWGLCLLLLYWISRTWMITRRGDMHEDPILFAIRDRASLLTALSGAVILWLAT